MPNQFQRGFEAFGKALPIRGITPPAPIRVARGPEMGSASAPASAPVQPQVQATPEPSPALPGRIKVYKKGEPGAPPCPVCR
jgi:hypothetical protein